MAQIPYSTGIKPLVKPVAKPAGNPADRNFFSGSAVPIAPKVAPTVNMVRPSGPTPTNNFFNYTPPAPAAPKDNFLRGSKASSNPYMAQEFAKANADPNPGLRLPQYTSPSMPNSVGGTVASGVADLIRVGPPLLASRAGPYASAAVAGGSEAAAQWWENKTNLRSGYSQEQLAGNTVLGGLFSNWGGKPVTTGIFQNFEKPHSGPFLDPEYIKRQIFDSLQQGVDPLYAALPSIRTRLTNIIPAHAAEYPSRMKSVMEAIKRMSGIGEFDPERIKVKQDYHAGHDLYGVSVPEIETFLPLAGSSGTNIKSGVDGRGSPFPIGGLQYTYGNSMKPGWFMKNQETIDAANQSSFITNMYDYIKQFNTLVPRLPKVPGSDPEQLGLPNKAVELYNLKSTLQRIFGGIAPGINYDDDNVVQGILKALQEYDWFQKNNLGEHMANFARKQP